MYDMHGKYYYVNELTQLRDGTFIIPFRWVIYHNSVHAQARTVRLDDEVRSITYRIANFRSHNTTLQALAIVTPLDVPILVPVSEMEKNYLDLLAESAIPSWHGEYLGACFMI